MDMKSRRWICAGTRACSPRRQWRSIASRKCLNIGAVSGRELAMRRGNWDALAPTIGKLPNLGLVGKVQACVQGGGADAAGPADGASRPCPRAGLTARKPWPPPARQRGYGLLQ
uniref:Uncharacterized protein n=1 Tax=Ralstonia solanacearum TaxID=305 RepID=A0A0S4UZV2_RALSL|nr:protein of unknown function [Ralstonia solanacearum]CUV27337.1 protein of unknown function [Ralstonia solanacearum]